MKGGLSTYQPQRTQEVQNYIKELHEENERLKQELEESKKKIESLQQEVDEIPPHAQYW